jgi:phosphatidylserine decarboxylase
MIKLAKYGTLEWGGSLIAAIALCLLGSYLINRGHAPAGWTISLLAVLVWLAIAAFFRVPERSIPAPGELLVSPADGVVVDIERVTDHGIEPYEGQEMLMIGIFLSVLDVHVNRAPCPFEIEYRNHKEGKYLDARSPRCAKENEALVIAGTATAADTRFPMAIRQISGAIARRIVCEPQPGDTLEKGEIYGMIKFGSRTELYLPVENWIEPAVEKGDKVRSGSSVIARINKGLK